MNNEGENVRIFWTTWGICPANQLTGFFMMGTLFVKGLILEAKFGYDPKYSTN